MSFHVSLFTFVDVVAAASAALSRPTKIFIVSRQANDKVKNKVKWTEFNFFRLFFSPCLSLSWYDSYKFTLHFICKKIYKIQEKKLKTCAKHNTNNVDDAEITFSYRSQKLCLSKIEVFFYNFFILYMRTIIYKQTLTW